jgi:zinc transporter 1/2/3
MEATVLQAACVLLMFVLHFGAGLSPLLIVRCCGGRGRRSSRVDPVTQLPITNSSDESSKIAALPTWINCFAGGVFIAMCFLGLLPFAQEKFDDVDFAFPLPPAQLCVVAGIFFVLFLEAFTQSWMSRRKKEKSNKSAIALREDPCDEYREDRSPLMVPEPEKDHSDFTVEFVSNPDEKRPDLGTNHGCHSHGGVSLDDLLDQNPSNSAENGSVFFLFLAINLHAFFEGMALGLQTEPRKLVSLFVGILVHEMITAFALGVSVVRKRFGFAKVAKYLLSFSASIPAGILLGVLVSAAPGDGGKLASAVLQAFSAGVLLHVIFMEIIPEELGSRRSNGGAQVVKIFYFLLGFVFLGCLSGLLHQAIG